MNATRTRIGIVAAAAAWLAVPIAPALAGTRSFSLTEAVPSDVFLVTAARGNPERAFLDEYWEGIWDAAGQTGVTDDLFALIGSFLDEDQMAEVERLKARAMELIGRVNWEQLGAGEVVFAERMVSPVVTGSGGINAGPPELVFLIRSKEAEKNYEGLVGLLEGALDEIEKAANRPGRFALEKATEEGVSTARINFTKGISEAPSIAINVARRGDVIVLTLGDPILKDVLGLLSGESDTKGIGQTKRFKAAFAKLPPAEDSLAFFDMQAMLQYFRSMGEMILAAAGGAEDVYLNSRQDPQANELMGQSMEAYNKGDIKEALALVKKAHEANPDDALVMYNLACFHALSGDKDAALSWLEKAVEGGFYAPGKIAGDDDLKTLRDERRFAVALASAGKKAAAYTKENEGGHEKVHEFLMTRILGTIGILDYTAEVEVTEGHSVHKRSIVSLVPGAEKNPIYPVFAQGQTPADFDRFLPVETESFSVSGGIDVKALYAFVLDTVRGLGPMGDGLLAQWAAIQEQIGVDIEKDVLGWIEGGAIQVTLADDGGSAMFVKVSDAEAAQKNVSRAIGAVSAALTEAAAQNPMLGMLAIRRSPSVDDRLEGFENLQFGMSPKPAVWGVADGYLVFATGSDVVVTCLATAKGKHPSIKTNERVMSEALIPDGGYTGVGLTDQRKMGEEIAMGLGMASMVAGMVPMAIPDPTVQRIVGKIAGMVGKLAPVAAQIDFYKSTATQTTFDGQAWQIRQVTHYLSPTERAKMRLAAARDEEATQ